MVVLADTAAGGATRACGSSSTAVDGPPLKNVVVVRAAAVPWKRAQVLLLPRLLDLFAAHCGEA